MFLVERCALSPELLEPRWANGVPISGLVLMLPLHKIAYKARSVKESLMSSADRGFHSKLQQQCEFMSEMPDIFPEHCIS